MTVTGTLSDDGAVWSFRGLWLPSLCDVVTLLKSVKDVVLVLL